MVQFITSKDAGHRHKWERGRIFSTINQGHRHTIDFSRRKALPFTVGGHMHRLLKTKS